jgi:hypothetical protein
VLVGVNGGEVAVAVFPPPGLREAVPTGVSAPLGHPDLLGSGPQAKKLTVPDGGLALAAPVTVAASAFWAPSVIEPCCGAEAVVEDAWLTVKHSPLELSLEPL